MDPAVAAIVGDGRQRSDWRKLTPVERRAAQRRSRREAERQAARQRITVEMDPRVVELVRQVAAREGCSVAGALDVLAAEGLRRYAAGEVQFEAQRRESNGPRYRWVVEVDVAGLDEFGGTR